MTFFDLFSLTVENLARRKGRVALTAVGVIIGTAAVVLLVSLGVGLQQNAASQLGGIGDLTKIQVWPNYGEWDPVTGQPSNFAPLTNQTIADISALPGVTAVIPQDYFQGGVMMNVGQLEGGSQIIGIGTDDLSNLGLTAQAGSLALERGTVIVGAMVPQNFYNPHLRPGQEPPPPPDLMGQQLSITLIKWSPTDGTEIRKQVRVHVGGIIAEARDEPDWSIYMPLSEMEGYNTWVTGQRIDRQKNGYPNLVVRVGDIDQVIDVTEQITTMGYQAYTPQSFVQGINGFYLVLQVVFGGVGAIALLVAAIGIANTMAMAILERTREIGLMKAVGATNRHVLSIFLGESAGIGFLGGLGGVLLGWGLGQVVNVFALAYMAGQSVQTGAPPPSVAVSTPAWLPPFTLIFATIIGLLSGLYPALSAATMTPVTALKYE
ncbi:MAG: ABC transporter permease [Ardenticatenaceae bacterium]|nr:ABC transporter permease [Ardenticatenaceae bacterium]